MITLKNLIDASAARKERDEISAAFELAKTEQASLTAALGVAKTELAKALSEKAELEKANADLSAAMTDFTARVDAATVAAVASQGVPVATLPSAAPAAAAARVVTFEEFKAMNPTEAAREFALGKIRFN